MVEWECPTDPREASGLDPEAVHTAGQEQGRWVTQCAVAESGNVTPTTVQAHYETLTEQVA